MRWHPIETAPHNCVVLITGFAYDDPAQGRWLAVAKCKHGEWYEENSGGDMYPPTHWTPVPPFPEDV